MKPRQSLRIALIAGGLAAVALGAWGIWRNRQRPIALPKPAPLAIPAGTQPLEVARLTREHAQQTALATLSDRGATDGEIFNALTRLGGSAELPARDYALAHADSQSTMVRAGVASALRLFDDPESLAVLKKLSADQAPLVRQQAISAIGAKSTEDRRALIETILESTALDSRSRVLALKARHQLARNAAERSAILKELLGLGEFALTIAAAIAPRDGAVVSAVREAMEAGGKGPTRAIWVRHLAVAGDPWARQHYGALIGDPDPEVRLVAIGLTHLICPKERWQALGEVIEKQDDPRLREAAASSLAAMPSVRSLKLLERARARAAAGVESARLDELLKIARQSRVADPCAPKG